MRRPGAMLAAAAAVLAVGASGCSDAVDDGPSAGRSAYVEAFAEVVTAGDRTASREEALCIAEATVDTLGVEELQAEVTPADVRDGRSTRPPDLGISVEEQDGDAFHRRLQECMDVRAYLVDASAGADDVVADEVLACVSNGFDDGLVRRIVVDSFVNPSDGRDPDVQTDVQAVFQSCADA